MGIHSRSTPLLALVGILLLGVAPGLRAQQPTNAPPKDTSAMAQPDTTAYQGYQRNDSSPAGKTKPTQAAGAAAAADTVVCKDGSSASKAAKGCTKHGGIDWAATKSALKARGQMQGGDTSGAAPADTSKKGADTSSSYKKP
jgi:hypothetical protein